MTIKATSVASILAIWVASIIAVSISPGAWWILIFAFLSTGAVGASAWRRLGVSRLIAIMGIWAGLAVAVGYHESAAWISVFAFLSTGAVVYSGMRRDAAVLGLGIAAPWIVSGAIVAHNGESVAWAAVFAFLTAGGLANSRGNVARGVASIIWWGAAGAVIVIAGDGWTWLCVPAFILAEASVGFGDFHFPRGIEWDFFDRDGDKADESRWVN